MLIYDSPYNTIFDTVPKHHSDSIAFLHPLPLESSCESIALNIQILICQGSVLMTGYHATNEVSAHTFEWKTKTNRNSRRSITMLTNHVSEVLGYGLRDQWRLKRR
jgi:hypothetical protein